jgi:hypothetical protein
MKIRPVHVFGLFVAVLAIPAWRLCQRGRSEFVVSGDRVRRWVTLTRFTAEELEHGVAHRYLEIAAELKGTRDVGYFGDASWPEMWAAQATPAGRDRIERYYMAQSMLAPALLRFDELHALIVIDCATPEQADGVLNREGVALVRDFGRGLLLARPES